MSSQTVAPHFGDFGTLCLCLGSFIPRERRGTVKTMHRENVFDYTLIPSNSWLPSSMFLFQQFEPGTFQARRGMMFTATLFNLESNFRKFLSNRMWPASIRLWNTYGGTWSLNKLMKKGLFLLFWAKIVQPEVPKPLFRLLRFGFNVFAHLYWRVS